MAKEIKLKFEIGDEVIFTDRDGYQHEGIIVALPDVKKGLGTYIVSSPKRYTAIEDNITRKEDV